MSQQTNADGSDFPNKEDLPDKDAPSGGGSDKEAAANASLATLEQWIEMVEDSAGVGSGVEPSGSDASLLDRSRALEERIKTIEVAALQRSKKAHRPLRRLLVRLVIAVILLVPYYWLWEAFDGLATERENAAMFWTLARDDSQDDTRDSVKRHERVTAFLALASGGHREWRSAKLRELDLKGAQLRGTVLSWARFQTCTLKSARFDGADLSYTTFNQSDLQGAVLRGARMHETFFQVCNLTAVDARGADLSGAVVQAQLSAGNFQGADFTRARLRGSRCIGVRFDGAKMVEVDLTDVDLGRCVLTGTDLHGAKLDGVRLTDSNWWRAKGLTAEQMQRYAEEFAPTEKASAELRADFEAWKRNDRS